LFVANTAEIMPGDFTRNPDFSLPVERLKRAIGKAAGEGMAHFFDATETTRALFGNTVAANMFMLGYAFQYGGVPLSAGAVEKAIVLNGEAVTMNVDAFQWGRRAAHEPDFVRAMVAKAQVPKAALATSLDDIISKRAAFLSDYQNAAYSAHYMQRLEAIKVAEAKVLPGSTALTETAARSLFKLMAIKDEYEVARLYTNGAFAAQLGDTFASYERLEFHLAPPAFSSKNAKGQMMKRRFGPWMLKAFGVLAQLKFLRGTAFDMFGYSAERRMERGLITAFEQDLAFAVERLNADNFDDIKALLALPMDIRGYGHVKHANMEKSKVQNSQLMAKIMERRPVLAVAAE
jgi:indolepyruvate ferredoxin oxidoreductase